MKDQPKYPRRGHEGHVLLHESDDDGNRLFESPTEGVQIVVAQVHRGVPMHARSQHVDGSRRGRGGNGSRVGGRGRVAAVSRFQSGQRSTGALRRVGDNRQMVMMVCILGLSGGRVLVAMRKRRGGKMVGKHSR